MATYKPFGTPIVSASTLKEKARFAGEMQDSATGLYYIFARYMDPELGRWLSLDPELGSLSMPQSMNRYVYCVNNPLRFTDPTGRLLWVAVGALVGFVGGTVVYAVTTPRAEWTWEDWAPYALGGAAAGAVTALTFNPAWGATTWTAIAGGAAAGAAGGAVGGAVEYQTEHWIKVAQGERKPSEFSLVKYYKQMGLGALFGAAGGALGGLGGKVFGKLVGQSSDDFIRGLSRTRPWAAVGASFSSQLPDELVSEIVERLIRRALGMEDAVVRYASIGVFPKGFLTTETTLAGYTRMGEFMR